jgi:hypothetical protein
MTRSRFSACSRLALAAAVLLGCLTWSAQTSAAGSGSVFHVAPGGSDAASGSEGAPWRTLGRALRALRGGDSLVVAGGTYVERVGGKGTGGFVNLSPGSATSPVVVRAASGARPVLQGVLWVEGMDHWTFDGLNVTWDDATGAHDEHMVRFKNGVGWTFENAEVWGARSYANVNVLSDVANEPSGWALRGNCIHDNVGDPAHGTAKDQLLYVNTGLTAGAGVIERNLLFGAPRGKAVKLAGPAAGTGSTNVTVRYNTIVDTYKPPVNLAWDTEDSRIHHNLIGETQEPTKGLVRGYELTGTGNRVHDNYGWGATGFVYLDSLSTATVETVANTVATDPLFDHRGCDGFRPQNPTAQRYGRYADLDTTEATGDTTTAPLTAVVPVATTDSTLPRYDPDSAHGTIYRLYRAYFLREPDLDGYRYWLQAYRGGYPLRAISADFARSAEFVQRYGELTDREFVTRVYRNVLGRTPDATGYSYWLDQMRRGLTRGELMIYFSDSTEYRRLTADGVPPGYRA